MVLVLSQKREKLSTVDRMQVMKGSKILYRNQF